MLQHLRQRMLAAAVALATLACGGALAREKPKRVVSLNLCADQLLLALADRDQIASLSPLARDPSISFLAQSAGDIPVNGGEGEAILFSGADLVLSASFGAQAQLGLLERQGLEVMVLDPWTSLDDGRKQIRTLADRLGQPARGEALIAAIDAAMLRAESIAPGRPSVLTYYRRGWVPSTDSLVSELLRHVGFRLHQDAIGVPRGGVVRLESIVATPPDYALMDEVVGDSLDQGSALLIHPALLQAVPPERRLVIPGHLAICGGPSTPATIDALAREVRAKVR